MTAADKLAAFERAHAGTNFSRWSVPDIEQHNRLLRAAEFEREHGGDGGEPLPLPLDAEIASMTELRTRLAELVALRPTAAPWVSDGYDVKQPGGRAVAYFGPHHTSQSDYPMACKLEDERNAEFCAGAANFVAWLDAEIAQTFSQPKPTKPNKP